MALGIFTGISSDASQYPASPEFPRPLDIFGGVAPAFAYGLRLLDSDYAGYAIRVRHGSSDIEVEVKFDGAGNVSLASPIVDGGYEQTTGISDAGTYSGTMTLGAFAGVYTVHVVKWYDQSGNTRDAFQSVEANQPILITSGVLEADGIDFVPNDYLQANYLLTTTNDHTFHAVVKTDVVGTFGVLSDIDGSYNDGAELLTQDSVWSHHIDSTDLDVPATTTGKSYILASYEIALSASNEQQMRVNGVYSERACSETLSFGTANRIRVGARRDTDNPINGKISEIIAWNSKVTTAQQSILESNTMAHHGLAVPYSATSILFDGGDDWIETSADDTLATKSYSFWAKSDDTTSDTQNGLFDHGSSTIGAFFFNWYASRPFLYLQGSGCWRYWDDNAAQDDGNWHHWCVVIHSDPANCLLYCDGILQSVQSTVASTSAAAYTTGLRIGQGGGNYFDGSLDEFAIFDGELSAAQILSIYNNGKPADLASFSPTSWWRMGDSNSGYLIDDEVATDSNALYLPGVASNYVSVPDSSDLDGWTDFTIELTDVTVPDWTPSSSATLISKSATASKSWVLQQAAGGYAGKLAIYLSFNGSTETGYYSSVATGIADGATASIRVIRSGTSLTFELDTGSGYAQLGTTVTVSASALHAGSRDVMIGTYESANVSMFEGSIGRARIWSDATQTTNVLDINFALASRSATSFAATSGQTVTVHTTDIATQAAIRKNTDGILKNGASFSTDTPLP
jgi:hypothetical protein